MTDIFNPAVDTTVYPAPGTATRRVWDTLDTLRKRTFSLPSTQAVVHLLRSGIDERTICASCSTWRAHHGIRKKDDKRSIFVEDVSDTMYIDVKVSRDRDAIITK